MPNHVCPGFGCDRQIPFGVLACRKHWARVSPATKRAVLDQWRNDPLGDGYRTARADAVQEMR